MKEWCQDIMGIKMDGYRMMSISIILFSVATLTYRLIDPYLPLNIFGGFIFIVALIWIYLENAKQKDIVFIMMILLIDLISFIMSSGAGLNIKDAVYWTCTLLSIWMISDRKISKKIHKAFSDQEQAILIVTILNNIVILFGMFRDDCYSGVWGERYFLGYAYSNHVLASGVCLNLCLTLFATRKIKGILPKIVLMVPGTFALLQSGARTFLISVILIWFFFFIYHIDRLNTKMMMIPAFLSAGVYVFFHSNIIDKFVNPNAHTSGGLSGIDRLTNGRTTFWLIDLFAYKEFGFVKKIFGGGFDLPYHINLGKYGMYIWSHNDFIETLLSAGFLGVFVYGCALLKNYKSFKKHCRMKWPPVLVLLYFLIVAFCNGLFGYQHYLYSYIVLYIFVDGAQMRYREPFREYMGRRFSDEEKIEIEK